MGGLVPAIIQDNYTQKVLMLGFMNEEAYQKTVETGKVTFFSRTKNRLWTKGEESGNFLNVVDIKADCDNDTLLIQVNPVGPVCHTGADTGCTYSSFTVSNDVCLPQPASNSASKKIQHFFTSIPSFATAPALIMVGFLMVSSVTEIRFDDDNLTEAIPAYIAIIAMPLFYSISEGISLGIISYVVLNACTGKAKKVNPLMYVLAVLFVLKYIFL